MALKALAAWNVALPLQAHDLGPQADALRAQSGAPAVGIARVSAQTTDWAVAGHERRFGPLVRQDALWHLGSLGKAMTATLAARLVETGLVRWTTTVGDVFGPSTFETITLEDLLRHRGRLPRDVTPLRGWPGTTPHAQRRAVLSTVLRSRPLAEGTAYSNLGYVIAATMMETELDTPFETLLAKQVFAPLGIRKFGFGPPRSGPLGHRWVPLVGHIAVGTDAAADNPPIYAPAGTVHMDLEGYAQFLRAHAIKDPAFLSQQTWARLHRAEGAQRFAMGWIGLDRDTFVHAGSNGFWYAQTMLRPKSGEAWALVSNSGHETKIGPAFDRFLSGRFARAQREIHQP